MTLTQGRVFDSRVWKHPMDARHLFSKINCSFRLMRRIPTFAIKLVSLHLCFLFFFYFYFSKAIS